MKAKLLRLFKLTPHGEPVVVLERVVPLPGDNELGRMHLDLETATYLHANLGAMIEEMRK